MTLDEGNDYLESFLSSAFGDLEDSESTSTLGAGPIEPTPEWIGRYRVIEPVGEGGIGVVYRVEDDDLGRDLAAKVLRQSRAGDAELRRRFIEEARTCSRLQHPGVVPIHEISETEDGRPFFTMKLVAGKTLDAWIAGRAEGGPSRRDLELFERLCQTIAFVHSHRVVHGDLKPQNVMVGEFGELQVMDWGFARSLDLDEGEEPARPRVIGTPAYMAPEQAQGDARRVTTRTDVFGLGAILCQLLTGEPPHVGETKADVMRAASAGEMRVARQRLTGCGADETLIQLAVTCLEPDPVNRPADAAAVAEVVTHHLAERAARARALELEAAEARAVAAQERRNRRLAIALTGTVAISAVAVAAGLVWFERDRSQRRAVAERQLSAAEERARMLRDQGAWAEVRAAASELIAYSQSPDLPPPTIERAEFFSRELLAQADAATLDAKLVESLADLRTHLGDDRSAQQLDRSFATIFRERSIDVDGDPEVAADRLRGSRLRGPLIEALDEWIHHRRRARDDDSWRQLVDIANRADDDPWRTALREAYESEDVERLRELSRSPGSDDSPGRLDLLARCLLERDDLDTALDVYREAAARYPGDFWIHHNLASKLGLLEPRPSDEIHRHLAMAVAIQPDSAHAHTDLALEHHAMGRLKAAERSARKAREIDPDYIRATFVLGVTLVRLGLVEEAIPLCRRAYGRGYPAANTGLIQALVRTGRGDEALSVAEEAVAKDPDAAIAHYALAALLVDDFRYDEALDETAAAIRLDPDIADVYGVRALALFELGRYDESFEALSLGTAAAERTGRPMAQFYAQARPTIDHARALSRVVDQIRGGGRIPPGAPIRMTLGRIAFQRGFSELAAELFDEAWEIDPEAFDESQEQFFTAARAAAHLARETEDPDDESRASAWMVRALAPAIERWRQPRETQERLDLLQVRKWMMDESLRFFIDGNGPTDADWEDLRRSLLEIANAPRG